MSKGQKRNPLWIDPPAAKAQRKREFDERQRARTQAVNEAVAPLGLDSKSLLKGVADKTLRVVKEGTMDVTEFLESEGFSHVTIVGMAHTISRRQNSNWLVYNHLDMSLPAHEFASIVEAIAAFTEMEKVTNAQ